MRFETVKIADLISEIAMGPFGSNIKVECFVDEGIPVLNGSNLNGYALNEDSFRYVTEEKANSLGRANAHRGDVVITHRGTLGQIVFIPEDSLHERYVISQSQFRVKCNEKVLPEYLVYFFHTRIGQHKLLSNASQVGVPALARASTTFQTIEIDIPDMESQRQIVDLLETIRRKVEINNEINENLEQQALALFRHYFMDYQPYGGSVPSGWTEVSLDDVCVRITDGSHYSPADTPEAPYPMYSVKDMETYGFNSSSCKHIKEEEFHKMQKNDCVPRLNDILVAKDGSYLKEIFICSEEKDEAILSSIAIFRPNTEIIMPEILLYLLKQPSVRRDVGDNYVSGSALPRIVLKDFKKYTFLLPPMTEQLKIGSILHTIRMQTKANIDEIQHLSALRDTLLPRLMSGELDVSDLEL